MLDFAPSEADNQEVYAAYLESVAKLEEAAAALKNLKEKIEDKFMAVTITDRKPIEKSITEICSASWCLRVQGFRVKNAGAKNRIMTAC